MTKKIVHPNFIKASNLYFIMGGIGLVSSLIKFNSNDPSLAAASAIISPTIILAITVVVTLLFVGGLGLLIRQGYDWVKYLILVLTAIGLIGTATSLFVSKPDLATGSLSIIQTAIQVWVIVLLFQAPKNTEEIIKE